MGVFGSDSTDTDTCLSGHVKWFDTVKGFGFVVCDTGGPDILLHANVLRNFGRSSVAEGARIILRAQRTDRGIQATEVKAIEAAEPDDEINHSSGIDIPDATDVPLVAARVKWFDKVKGFGFVNVFGDSQDVFLHVEVLRRFGFADVIPGEAIAIKVVDGPRGKMAAMVRTWDEI